MNIVEALGKHQAAFGLEIAHNVAAELDRYHQFLQSHNELLHLVGPCSPEEFATRHILESLTMLEFLPQGARFADVGSGGGLPAIPCLIARPDLTAVLIESKEKKAAFLKEACEALALTSRAVVENKQFAETGINDCWAVSCRALDKFADRIQRLLKWAGKRRLLLFGGENLRTALQTNSVQFDQKLMPLSEQRFLFICTTGG